MSLTNVWVATQGDGLVRADQITGIDAHQTPELSGKPSRWLLDAVLGSSIGSGTREGWAVTMVHRTLIQTSNDPQEAPVGLARLLAQLDHVSAAGVVTVSRHDGTTGSAPVQFRFTPFTDPDPGRRADTEYL